MITIHYHRFDEDYQGIGLWTWDAINPGAVGMELAPSGQDDYGVVFHVRPGDYDASLQSGRIGFIPHFDSGWERRDGDDRFWAPEMGDELWLVDSDASVYTERPDIAPHIRYAFLDGERLITLRLSHGMTLGRLIPLNFLVKSAEGAMYGASAIRALDAKDGKARSLELVTAGSPDPRHELMVLVDGYRPAPVLPRRFLFESGAEHADVEMGPLYERHQTLFRLFAPTAGSAEVILYDKAHGSEGREIHPMTDRGMGIWEAQLRGDLHGRYYMVKSYAAGPHTRREVIDIHARCCTGHTGRGRVVDLRRLDPPGFRPVKRPGNIARATDAVIYELHIRDFTISEHSGVPKGKRGKYLGAVKGGTLLPLTTMTTGIDHLVELGITHVQLLPIQEFEKGGKESDYDWGYMPSNFNSPAGWYASNALDDSRVREVKQMVKGFHDAGIRVVMDVVYNHTAPSAGFESLAPGYYHRLRPDGRFWNGSGCGNEFRSEAPMGRKFIVDTCRYWIEEYGIDGFRFDLMGLIDVETLCELRDELHEIDPTILVYGEPWAALPKEGVGAAAITYKETLAGTGIGGFNDHFRSALKGSPNGRETGFVQGGVGREAVKRGIEGAIRDWARHPHEAIQYVTCHDNLTLWDKLEVSAGEATVEERMRMQMLCAGILAVSQGVMFLHGGHELARTKYGHHNSYNMPDDINRMEWERKARFESVFRFVKGMIALRRAHPVFRLYTREEVEARLQWRDELCPAVSCLAFTLDGQRLAGESWKRALVLINPEARDLEFPLPTGQWMAFVQGPRAGTTPMLKASGTIFVPARSMAVLSGAP